MRRLRIDKHRKRIARVLSHKEYLKREKNHYLNFRDTVFVFQTFNKEKSIPEVLRPFLDIGASNIIVFADGCVDDTAQVAHKMLPSPTHIVISSNDTHEIANYRLSLHIGKIWNCKYAILLQDDDIYTSGVAEWVSESESLMESDPSIAIVGMKAGVNMTKVVRLADIKLTTAEYRTESVSEGSQIKYTLGNYEEGLISTVVPLNSDVMAARPVEGHTAGIAASSNRGWCYAQTVNRAPQLLNIEIAISLGFFPASLEPFQYDDYYNCMKSWSSGYRVAHMPISHRRSVGEAGGMRLYNAVTSKSRPLHFVDNFNYVMDNFYEFIASGEAQSRVDRANSD